MREAQLAVAREFLLDVTRLSIEPRGIRTPLGKLMIMDAAVDHGLTHDILKRSRDQFGAGCHQSRWSLRQTLSSLCLLR